jgi:N4-gp56 family major capsid protein
MADAFTNTTTLTQATQAYERLAYFALRPELYFDRCADIKPTRQSHPGSSVLFNIYVDIAAATTALTEAVDPDAVAISDNEVTVALNEYGNAAITTARIRGYSYLVVSADVANVIGYNAGLTFDSLARNPLLAGTRVQFGTGGTVDTRIEVTTAMPLTAAQVRAAHMNLVGRNVQTVSNGMYRAYTSPITATDLRAETGAASWRDPHTYSQPEQIWNGEVGSFESFAFVETPRLLAVNIENSGGGDFAGAGAAGADVHPSIFMGRQALAKTWSSSVSAPMPQVVLGTVVDKLQRFVPVGWYWLGGFGRFREDALYRQESGSLLSIAA